MKLKNITPKPQTTNRQIVITKEQANLIDDYIEYVKGCFDGEIVTAEILPEVIVQFINSDAGFKKAMREKAQVEKLQKSLETSGSKDAGLEVVPDKKDGHSEQNLNASSHGGQDQYGVTHEEKIG